MSKQTTTEDMLRQLKEAVQQLEMFRQIMENASDGVVSINANHEVVYMNRAAERMFGYAREELMGGDLSPLIPTEYRQGHRYFVKRFVKTRQPRLMGHVAEVTAQRRDGERFPMHIGFSVAEVDGGPLFTAIMRDLSQERQMAERVKRSENLALLGQMVATVSHEIRHPLALIGGFARQVQRDGGGDEREGKKLSIIVEEVARLEDLLNELNDLSRPAKYDWNQVRLDEVLDHVLELMAPEMNGREIRLEREEGLPVLVADRAKMSQVLINLISNALQASDGEPLLAIRLFNGREGAQVLEVEDHGRGIAAEDLKRVFEPFFTTRSRGTGLGLPVAQRIVEEHGGCLELDSTPGVGTTARIILPCVRGSRP